MTKEFINDAIFVTYFDRHEEDEAHVWIEDTKDLDYMMDEIRKAKRLPTFFIENDEMDLNGWYDFKLYFTQEEVTSFCAIVCNGSSCYSEDDEYEIPLTAEEKVWMFERIKSEIGEREWNYLWEEE